jgi:nucleotide-binding universal stress UspA family protein
MSQKMKILIGYDGSECAEAALDDLQRAGLPQVAEALVMSVTELWLPPPPPSSFEIVEQAREVHAPADLLRVYAKGSAALADAESLAERAVLRLRANFPKWEMTAVASIGSPHRELITKADEWQPDLIVVGSHGRSTFKRFVLGSVSQGVLTHAHCSVRVARGRVDEPDTPVRIVVGVDGSPASAAAVSQVQSRPWPSSSEANIVAVNDPLTPTFIGHFIPPVAKTIKESNQADREWLRKVLNDCSERLRQSGLKVLTDIREGDPKRVLVEAANEWGADCIFVGSIGFSNPFERFVLGSVSASVAARAHCSVEVVRSKKITGGNRHERESEYSLN